MLLLVGSLFGFGADGPAISSALRFLPGAICGGESVKSTTIFAWVGVLVRDDSAGGEGGKMKSENGSGESDESRMVYVYSDRRELLLLERSRPPCC